MTGGGRKLWDAGEYGRLARRAVARLGWEPATLVVAGEVFTRLLGMVVEPPVDAAGRPTVYAFPLCNSVHTCFMRYPLNIAFVDKEGAVLAVREGVAPWRLVAHPGAAMALERASCIEEAVRVAPLAAT